MQLNNITRISCAFFILLYSTSCKKLVEVDQPKYQLENSYVFSSDATVTSAMLGIYIHMMENDKNFSSISVETTTGLTSDELVNYSTLDDQKALAANSLTPLNTFSTALWTSPYNIIYQANSLIEGLENAPAISAATKQQITGEAKFIRAYVHFYLVNLFGPVPYITSTDYRINAAIDREPVAEVYKKIITDLTDAQGLLTNNYITSEKTRPNKWTVKAFLARVYLYMEDWGNAETQAGDVIDEGGYSIENDLKKVFLKNSSETIWQLMPVIASGFNAWEGINFVLTDAPVSVALRPDILTAFESVDKRKMNWVGSFSSGNNTYYYANKIDQAGGTNGEITQYCMVLRLAEQYLIRAEARAKGNNLSDAIDDVDVIRKRAGLDLIKTINPGISKDDLLTLIFHERRLELFAEWGHRWLDLKRTGKAGTVLAPLKGSNWQSTDVLYPLPEAQIINSPVMKQNDGYIE